MPSCLSHGENMTGFQLGVGTFGSKGRFEMIYDEDGVGNDDDDDDDAMKTCQDPWREVPGGIGAMCGWCPALKKYGIHSRLCDWAIYHEGERYE